MRWRRLHEWRASYAAAVAIQESLRGRLLVEPLPRPVRLVAAADVACSRATHRMYAAVVVVALPSLEVAELRTAVRLARFPYLPGLFAFRELPPLLAAFERLRHEPDVLLFDGQGLAHPRRFGLACHAGLLLDRPSVGCAKSLLVGEHGPLGRERGAVAELRANGEVVGAALRTRDGVAPVYVSAGHRADLASSLALVLSTSRGFRLPEPTRLAHQATNVLMRRLEPRLRPPRLRGYPDFVRGPG